jgi:hypothetical protein
MKILICGDSFSADWTVKYQGRGWPNLLAEQHDVVNIAQAGCSQYRIYQQILSQDLDQYDAVLISHTSPNRIYVKQHPVHHDDPLHCNADLIYTDIREHAKTRPELDCIVEFYTRYFDLDYAAFTHNLICEKIQQVLEPFPGRVIHSTNLPRDGLYVWPDMVYFTDLMDPRYKGAMNHYNDTANRMVFDRIMSLLQQ